MKNLVFALLCASLLNLGVATAKACSCAPPPEPKIALQNAEAVWSGKVLSVETKEFQNQVVIQIKSVWKGTLGATTTLLTGSNGAICGFDFKPNQEYLIYAFKSGGEVLRTNLCTRTKTLESAADDLAALGEPIETKANSEKSATEKEKTEAAP